MLAMISKLLSPAHRPRYPGRVMRLVLLPLIGPVCMGVPIDSLSLILNATEIADAANKESSISTAAPMLAGVEIGVVIAFSEGMNGGRVVNLALTLVPTDNNVLAFSNG